MKKKKKQPEKSKLQPSDTATNAEKTSQEKKQKPTPALIAEAKATPPTSSSGSAEHLANEVARNQNRMAQIEKTLEKLGTVLTAVANKVLLPQPPIPHENPTAPTGGQTVKAGVTAQIPEGLDINTLVKTLGPKAMEVLLGGGNQPAPVDPTVKRMQDAFQSMFNETFLQFVKSYDTKARIGDEVLKQLNAGKMKFEIVPKKEPINE